MNPLGARVPSFRIQKFEEEFSHLFFRQISFRYFFNEDQPEVPIEVVIVLVKMVVDCQPVQSTYIVPVFIHPSVGSLRFDFADILLGIAFHAKAKIYGVLRVAIRAMPNFVSGLAASVGKERSVY